MAFMALVLLFLFCFESNCCGTGFCPSTAFDRLSYWHQARKMLRMNDGQREFGSRSRYELPANFWFLLKLVQTEAMVELVV